MADMFKAALMRLKLLKEESVMKSRKEKVVDFIVDFFITLLVVIFFLAISAFDDSYEDAKLSAKVLDEAIKQGREEKQAIAYLLLPDQQEESKE